ncbi:hypothetical protein KU73_17410 [Pectobacterium wasabiae]|uniref:Transposase n=1 Tax=Pectobacterium wasabiae TaxID=55208 RepID=A0AAW3EDU0_9GAMM|nr:hypothetical protein A7983_08040 [Pectobacterium wasabiae CFBP 3304]KFX04293.1 hypothetical protein JV38_17420 [Pectobacterium wasabiae]KGA27427.1 hypothetical protein KU73_17410 [Pectobacterium wasabiae]
MHIANQVFDYPDCTLAFKYAHRTLSYRAFDKQACVDQKSIVDNKRIEKILGLTKTKMVASEKD